MSSATLDDMPSLEAFGLPDGQSETIDPLWRAVDDLTPDLKMSLLLRDVVGLSYNEIADSLEVTLATVKWRIFKAREEVQLALTRDGVSFDERGRRPEPSRARARTTGPARAARERGRQAGGDDLCLRSLDRILGAAKRRDAGRRGRSSARRHASRRRAAARRSRGSAASGCLRARPRSRRSEPAGDRVAPLREREREVCVADEHERRGRERQRVEDGLLA